MKKGILLWGMFTLGCLCCTNLFAQSGYFWVGDSGLWSQAPSHWATTSGGNVFHNSVPGPLDTVHFDQNSGTGAYTVTLDVAVATTECFDLSIDVGANNFELVGELHVFGSLDIQGSADVDQLELTFRSRSQGETIRSGSNPIKEMILDGEDGEWTLQDSLHILSGLIDCLDLVVYAGTLRTGDFPISTDGILVVVGTRTPTANRHFDGGSSRIYTHFSVPVGCGYHFRANGANSSVDLDSTHFLMDAVANATTARIQIESVVGPAQIYKVEILGDGFATLSLADGSEIDVLEQVGTDPVELDLWGDITLDSLQMNGAGGALILQSGKTYTIRDHLFLHSDCQLPTTLRTEVVSGQATLASSTTNLSVDLLRMGNIHANVTGTASATRIIEDAAFNPLGNTGWNPYDTLAIPALYWIGGLPQSAGDNLWNNAQNWSNVSGGPPQTCIPIPTTTVYFDVASFGAGSSEPLLVNSGPVAKCHDLIWSGTQGSHEILGEIEIYGSLALQDVVDCDETELIFRSSSLGETIETSSNAIKEIAIDGENGEWTLLDSLSIVTGLIDCQDLTIYAGTFRTGDFPIDTDGIVIISGGLTPTANRHFDGGASRIHTHFSVPVGCGYHFRARSAGTSVDLDSTHFIMDAVANITTSRIVIENTVGPADIYRVEIVQAGYSTLDLEDGSTIEVLDQTGGAPVLLDFLGSIEFDTLQFNGVGGELILQAGKTYAINDHIQIASDCAFPTTLRTEVVSGQATLASTTTDILLSDLRMGNIHAAVSDSSASTRTIEDPAFNPLGNTGWDHYDTLSVPVLYWIGGRAQSAGDNLWNNPQNWSATSNGPPVSCIPLPTTDVYMDVGSFLTSSTNPILTSGTPEAKCKDLIWSGSLGTHEVIGEIEVYGSLALRDVVDCDQLDLIFRSDTLGQTIETSSNAIKEMTLDGNGGGWTLVDSLSIVTGLINCQDLVLYAGTFDTGDQPINTDGITILSGGLTPNATRHFDGGTSRIHTHFSVAVGCGYQFRARSSGTTVDLDSTYFLMDAVANATTSRLVIEDAVGATDLFAVEVTGNGFTTLDLPDNSTVHRARQLDLNPSVWTILGSMALDTVIVNGAGGELIFERGKTFQVNDSIQLNGNGCFPLTVKTTENNATAILQSLPAIDTDFLKLQDITVTGGATYNAGGNSQDDGGNTGWVFVGDTWTTTPYGNVLCVLDQDSVVLSILDYSYAQLWDWGNGNTDSTLLLRNDTIINVYLNYGLNCEFTDSTTIEFKTTQVLPATVLNFQGRWEAGVVKLTWEAKPNAQLDRFRVLESRDGERFSLLSTVSVSGAVQYRTEDANPIGTHKFYRLHTWDQNGNSTYSAIIRVVLKAEMPELYPNPATDFVTLTVPDDWKGGAGTLNLVDPKGQVLHHQRLSLLQNQIEIDLSFLAKGLYRIQLISEKGNRSAHTVVKQ